MLVAIGLMLLFVVVQGVALGVLDGLGIDLDLDGSLAVRDTLLLAAMQVAGTLAGVALVLGGVSSWRGVGLRAPHGAGAAGWIALVPVGLLVIAPTVGYVLATGGSMVHPSISLPEAIAYVVLAVLIAVNEELWFRGIIVDVLGGAARPWLVIVVSSLLFGLPHYAGGAAATLNALAVTLAVGVPFAAVRLRFGALSSLVAWHAIIDIWAFLHTSTVLAEGKLSASDVAAGLVLPTALAAGYVAWFMRSVRR